MSNLKLIAVRISYEKWLKVQMANPPRGIWRKIVENGIDTMFNELSEEQLLKDIDGLNGKLKIKQKILSDFRARKLEEELRLEREQDLIDSKKNSCFGCQENTDLIEKYGKLICSGCRNDADRFTVFRKKVDEEKEFIKSQIKIVKSMKNK